MADGRDEYRVLEQVRLMARLRGHQCRVVSPDEVELQTARGPHTVSLANLRMLVAQQPPTKRLAFVAQFVDALAETGKVDAAGATDFEETRRNLRVRLYPSDMQTRGAEPLRRDVSPGLAETAVIDNPTTVATPSRSITDTWPLTEGEIFEQGRANVRAGGRLELHSLDAAEAAIFGGYLDEYASAHALWLDEYPVMGKHGALVCIPVEGALYVHPLDGPDLIEAQNLLVRIALGRQEESARPISANLYHWDNSLAVSGQDHSRLCLAMAVELTRDQTVECFVEPTYQRLMESLV
jgi:hypothetical protein